jgi:hypothetical protein
VFARVANRFRLKVAVFMLPLLLPIGGAAVDAELRPVVRAPVEPWTAMPAASTALPPGSGLVPMDPTHERTGVRPSRP